MRVKKELKKVMLNFIYKMLKNLKFDNDTYDKYLISFCLRNITNIDQALKRSF